MEEVVAGVLAAAAMLVLLLRYGTSKKASSAKLPPGPRPWPIIANLLQVGPVPHEKTRAMNASYGPLVFLRLGCIPCIVTDEPKVVREILKSQDAAFASRPANIAAQHFTFGGSDIAFASHGNHWRQMRRLCTLRLLSPRRLAAAAPGRADEFAELKKIVYRAAVNGHGTEVNLRDLFGDAASNNLTRMLLGRRFFGPSGATQAEAAEHKQLIYEGFALVNAFNVADYLPWLRSFDLQGHEKRMKKIMERANVIYSAVIDEHRQKKKQSDNVNRPANDVNGLGEDDQDFVDVLLSLRQPDGKPLSDTVIKAVLIDMMAAGTDTSSITSEWTMAELVSHPAVMAKARDEIDTVVGRERVVCESDLDKLRYLRAVVKEVLRLHPVGGFLIPHVSTEETQVCGYSIPAGTRALINTYSLGRNPAVWESALEFKPERFFDGQSESVELFDSQCRMLPFGAGRRSCPGASLGTSMILLGVATLVHGFDWSPAAGGIDLRLAHNSVILGSPLKLVPRPRLASHLY